VMRASQKFDNEVWRQKRREVLPESLSSWYYANYRSYQGSYTSRKQLVFGQDSQD